MISFIPLNNLNNSTNLLIISEFTKLINETKDVIEYYSPYKKTKTNEGNYVDNLIFKLNAFENSLNQIKKYNYVINNGNQLKKVKGIGKGTIERIKYILNTGKLESEYPNLNEIYKIKKQLETEKAQIKLEPETVIQIENTQTEPETVIQTENTQTEPETVIQTENTETKPETVIQIENTQTEPETIIQNENTQTEPEIVIQNENTQTEPEIETTKDILGGCFGSTLNILNNVKSVFCSFYNDIYVNFNEELNLSDKTD